MNICKEREKLERLKNNAEVKLRQAFPDATTPLGHDIQKGWTQSDKVKYSGLKQEHEKANRQYELHKKNCLVCAQ